MSSCLFPLSHLHPSKTTNVAFTNSGARKVTINNVKATNGKYLVGINSNYGDTATITKTCAKSVKHICQEYKGTNNNNQEPSTLGEGPSKACIYKTSDVAVC